MRKAAVRHGDPTTTRGFVIAYSSTIHDDGKKVALSGDEATCGNCKGVFKIFGTGQGMSEKGRVVVVDGDQVLCPCKKNRVIAGSNPGIFLNITDEAATASSATAAHTSRGLSQRANGFDEQVQPVARGAAVQDYPYYILAGDGRIFSGRVDASGRLPRIDAQSAGDYTVYWGDDALAKQQGN
jgi:uncharacterized Zn-binding protein involved in type VI secretion